MEDCWRILAHWARRTPEGLDYEITLTGESGTSAETAVRAGREIHYVLTRIDWTDGHVAFRSTILGRGDGPDACARLRSEGAYLDLLLSQGIPTTDRLRRRYPAGAQVATPPGAGVRAASPAAPPEGVSQCPGCGMVMPTDNLTWRGLCPRCDRLEDQHEDDEARECQADKGGSFINHPWHPGGAR